MPDFGAPVAGSTPADGSVTNIKLASNAVTTDRVADATLTAADLAAGAAAGNLGTGSVTGTHILDATITSADFAAGAVGAVATTNTAVSGTAALTGHGLDNVEVYMLSGGQTVTLPAAQTGATLTLQARGGSLSFTIQRAGSDLMYYHTEGALTSFTSFTCPPGMRLQFICTSTGGWFVTVLQIPVVTTLPTTPFGGMTISYQTSAMVTAGFMPWPLRYNAGSASTYKWEVVGGAAPLGAIIDTSETTTSTTYADLATVGPSIALPLAGEYDVEVGCNCSHATAGAYALMSPVATGFAAVDTFVSAQAAVVNNMASGSRSRRITVTAASTLKAQYRTNAGTATYAARTIKATPIRVG